ncbi:unnamed protein product [Macrosiphum euphorbiae]|uniref:Uncharacterized protein n=1 Tax=Macrosiphum euphorbiae TaxID=13131 RepID=A0AAV0WRF2_9HEMI|nr:unnamed protein product [Macrosiphum euphorbiae]
MDRAGRGSTAASFEQHIVLFGADHQLLNISPPNSPVRRFTRPDVRRRYSSPPPTLLFTAALHRHGHTTPLQPAHQRVSPTPPPQLIVAAARTVVR